MLVLLALSGALVLSLGKVARAQDDAAKLEEAKELFRKGNVLRKAGDCSRALEYYAKSRRRVASVANTLNGAICLDRLGRLDEALQLYESVLIDFPAAVSDSNRNALAPKLRRLRQSVGSVDVASNTRGQLVIDGRPRGRLPLLSPVRVMPGEHTVAVMAEGFVPFTRRLVVQIGQTIHVVAKLDALANAGTLRIANPALKGAKVYIDGAHVATAPWDGKLAPGRYIVFLRRDDQGSAPQTLTIVDRRQTVFTDALSSLGPGQRFGVQPREARLTIDGVEVARGRWQGRLPVGEHVAEVSAAGYQTATRRFDVKADHASDLSVKLKVDSTHPRWQKPRVPGKLWFETYASLPFTSGLNSHAEAFCDDGRCTANEEARGYATGARVGYEWAQGLSVYGGGGYLSLSKSLRRELTIHQLGPPPATARYSLADYLQLSGPLIEIGMAYRHRINDIFSARALATIGVMFTTSADTIGGHVQQGPKVALAKVIGSGEAMRGVDLFISPELQVMAFFAGFYATLGFGATVMALEGPKSASEPATHQGELVVVGSDSCKTKGALACLAGSDQLANERGYGPFVFWRPALSLGYAF